MSIFYNLRKNYYGVRSRSYLQSKTATKPVVSINDSTGAYDKDGSKVTLEHTKIDAARTTLDDAAAATLYQRQRTGAAGTTDTIYPTIGDQLDMLYKDAVNGTSYGKLPGTWATAKSALDKYPKP